MEIFLTQFQIKFFLKKILKVVYLIKSLEKMGLIVVFGITMEDI